MSVLQTHLPFLYDFCSICPDDVLPYLKPVFSALLTKANAPFTNRVVHDLPVFAKEPSVTSFFPGLPQIVERGSYVLDNAPLQKELVEAIS